MLSYMLPIEEKPPPVPKGRLALEFASPDPGCRKKIISKESSTSSFVSDVTLSTSTPTGALDKPKHKLLANGAKHTSLKRVSFGSSKGSMVETLVFESPVQEEPETSPPPRPQETNFPYTASEEESERSKVRVTFYQGVRPQCVSPPAAQEPHSHSLYSALLAAASEGMADQTPYNRQMSTESGWDNPFRPDGDLSREADEIVSLIKGGKPITPTPAALPLPGCDELDEKLASLHASPVGSPQRSAQPSPRANGSAGANGSGGANGSAKGAVEVQRAPPPQPQQPEHVTIKKKPKCKCCVIQ